MPATFKDRTGEEFTIHLTLNDIFSIEAYDFQGHCKPVKLVPPEDKFFEERIGDPKLLFGIAWILVQRQIKGKKYKNPDYDPKNETSEEFVTINDELDFAYRFDGESLKNLKKGVWHELTGFFPEAATTIRSLIERLLRLQEIGIARGKKLIDANLKDEDLEKAWDEAEEKMREDAMFRGAGLISTDSPQ